MTRGGRRALAGLAVVLSTGCAPDPPAAVVGIVVSNCDPGEEVGSGAIVDDGLVLTSAHVVAGARSIEVRRDGRATTARVVGFDPEMDLAYLAIDGIDAEPLHVDSSAVAAGDRGVAYVVRQGRPTVIPVRVRRRVQIRTEDIYVEGETLRPGFELTADIDAGDSGAAVMVGGELVGVVWARSRKAADRAYAIDPVRAGDRIEGQRRTGDLGPDIDLARC